MEPISSLSTESTTPKTTPNKPPETTTTSSDQHPEQGHDIQSLIGSNDAKDKTQVASATSMAVIHVGILKALLDLGPGGLSYYDWCLAFVVTALLLQFISGIIAIYIVTMKSFLSQFKYDISYYCKRSLCPCIYESKSKMSVDSEFPDDSGESRVLLEGEEPNQSAGCCCCSKGQGPEELEYEDILIDTYMDWANKSFHMQLSNANIAEDTAAVKESIADLEEQRERALSEVSDATNPRVEDIDQRMARLQKHLVILNKRAHDMQKLQQKGVVLNKRLKWLMDQKVMKKAAFWQCILTILTYIIFALNTIITGFGLANLAKSEG